MSQYTSNDQWRSFQTFIAAYLAGMLHPRDVFTISRKATASPPVLEFRCDAADRLWLGRGADSWNEDDDARLEVSREEANRVAALMVEWLRDRTDLNDPSELRVSGSGPASSVAVLAKGGFLTGGSPDEVHPARKAAQAARMAADIDVEGDVIEASARAAGDRAHTATGNGTIAAQVAARELARLRNWVDPFSPTPATGYLVGRPREDREDVERQL